MSRRASPCLFRLPGGDLRGAFAGPLLLIVVGLLAVPAPAWSAKPGNPMAEAQEQMEFGIAMARRGLWSEALFRFRQADLKDPGNAAVLNNLAVASEAVGLFEEALDYYQRALKIDPSGRDLKRNYARFVEFYQAFKPEEEEISVEAEPDDTSPATSQPESAEGEEGA